MNLIIIPSRLASTRLPNKPLIDICGTSMIVRVCKQAAKSNCEILVAAGDQEIHDEVVKAGFNAVMTKADLPSGTDRIAQALEIFEKEKGQKFDIIVNLQGDLPIIEESIIENVLKLIQANTNYDITTAVNQFESAEQAENPNDVKAVIAWKSGGEFNSGEALYFTRAKAPFNASNSDAKYYHHIGIYAYKREALKKFVSLKESNLEKLEKLEQLRALENDMKIGVIEVSSQPVGVDTKEDLEKVIQILSS